MRTKQLFIIQMMSTAVFLCSCSSDDKFIADEDGAIDDYQFVDCEYVPIRLGVSPNSIEVTRGTGTVGSIRTDTIGNVWKAQHFKVMMLNQNSLTPTKFSQNDATPIFFGTEFVAPEDTVSGSIYPVDGVQRYFPLSGCSDFWAYRLDDAQVGELVPTDTTWMVNFKLDGSQDIMVAKSVPTYTQKRALGKNKTMWYYSAYSARKGVEPEFSSFRHLLTRLKFYVYPITSDAVHPTKGVTVTKIAVSTFTEGTLAVAALNDVKGEKQIITWNDAARDTILLKQRDKSAVSPENAPLVTLKPLVLRDSASYKYYPVGESMMVAPDSMYIVKVYFVKEGQPYCAKDTLYRNSKHSMFDQGASYEVRIRLDGDVSHAFARSLSWIDENE